MCHGERAPLGAAGRTTAELVEARGERTNGVASTNGASSASNAALLTLDSAMVLVEEALAAAGSQRACTREETQLAFQHLTNPIVGHAAWTDASQSSIIILSP